MKRALETELGRLPEDFIPEQYRSFNSDLADKADPWQLQEHYLRFGRAEGRIYRADLTAFERDYARMVALDRAAPRRQLDASPPASFAHLLASARVLPGPWLDRFMLHEFTLLNRHWLPRVPASRMEGLYLFLTLGIDRLAPLSLRAGFDPVFYRLYLDAGPGDDGDLYRRWLSEEGGAGKPGTEAAALRQLLGDDRFPACFDEARYRAALPETIAAPGPGRFNALKHFMTTGFSIWDVEPVRADSSARLLEQIAEVQFAQGHVAVAKEALDRALRIDPGVGRLHHRRGDALRLLNRPGEAALAYVAAARAPGAVVSSLVGAIDALLAGPDGVQAALEHVRGTAQDWHGSTAWRAAAHRAIEQSFALASRRARELYAAQRRTEADACLTECLDTIAALIPAVDPLPAPLRAPRSGHVVIVANRDIPQCDHYRVTQKVRQLEHGGWTVEVFGQNEGGACRPAIDRAAAVIFYRVAALPGILHAILYARALGLPTIYEIDDLLFDPDFYPDPLASFEGQITPAHYVELQYGVPLFRYAMRACDTGLASTPALAERMRPLVRSGLCHLLRNGLDQRNATFLTRPHVPFSETAPTIFYGSGTLAHNRDFTELAAPALLEILARYPEVRVVIAGYLHLDARFKPFAHRVSQLGFSDDLTAYWEVLSGVDINLAVLARGPTTDAKSEIKWLEAAMCGVPSVVSATRTYREILTDGENALLAETPQDWSRALARLIDDPVLRRQIGARARVKALAAYGLDRAVEALGQAVPAPAERPLAQSWLPKAAGKTVWSRRATKARNGKPRLLVVNVFFPPQTIGGATRVVRDNLDHLLDHAADRFEIAVAATDLDAAPAYRTRIDAYRGVPVYRVSTPRELHMDWRPFDPGIGPEFEALLDRFEPDLVHFHCIQNLTATVVEAVRTRGTPYCVTVHDAWWLSDFQFLIDEDGEVQRPSPDALADGTGRAVSPIASIARRRALARSLDGAAAIAAVSETFADLYRRAGFARTIAIPNGVPQLHVVPRRPDPDGRVRLGHIGGRAPHKGASLIEAVLRSVPFDHLALTLVDHALATDHVGEETWGTTPVRIVGKVPQERVGELYAELDVLLAPSLWPESFGLVTREARAAGLWVVASDRGAIGEDVLDGVDGFRIDVGNADGLIDALRRIDAAPERFRAAPPAAAGAVRTQADQGNDLLALYERILSGTDPEGVSAGASRVAPIPA